MQSVPDGPLRRKRRWPLAFLTENGRFLARVHGPVSGNVLLRREQYRWTDCEKRAAAVARSVVLGKIANSRTVVMRAIRERAEGVRTRTGTRGTPAAATAGDGGRSRRGLEEIRGHEGDAARVYFGVFDHLISTSEGGLLLPR